MAKPILYGFLVDDALRRTDRLDTPYSEDQGYGQLIGETANYFVNKGTINDGRRSRSLLVDNQQAFGRMSVLFDRNHFDLGILEYLTDMENTLLFNIIERIYLQQSYSDSTLEQLLSRNSIYRGYVSGSYIHSDESGEATILDISRRGLTCTFRDWIAFDFETENVAFSIHLWIGHQSFKENYPFVTITSVIPPYDPAVLMNPLQLAQSGNIGLLTTGSSFVFSNVNLEMLSKDQNGVYTFYTDYLMDGRKISLPFALAYCGARVPTSLECRKAIKTYLEGALPEKKAEEFMEMFPELYVDSRFYLVPLWNMYYQLSDREVYTSIAKLGKLQEYAAWLFPDADPVFVEKYLEILLNSQNKMWTISLPDELNSVYMSIYEQHPTYQDYSSQVAAGFRFMSASTQEFAAKLAKAMAILNGDLVSPEYVRTEINKSWYLGFTSGLSEYLIMERDSFMKLIPPIRR